MTNAPTMHTEPERYPDGRVARCEVCGYLWIINAQPELRERKCAWAGLVKKEGAA